MIYGNYDRDYLRTPEPEDDDEVDCINAHEEWMIRQAEEDDHIKSEEQEKKYERSINLNKPKL